MKKQRNLWLVRLLVLVLACSFAFTFALASAPTPSAHAQGTGLVYLGGVDLGGYCHAHGYVSVRTVGTTYYDWRCIDRNGNNVAFSMQAACQWQYHNVNAWDFTNNFYSVTGGFCEAGSILGGVNLRGFCQSEGYYDVALLGSTAYDWRCLERLGTGSIVPGPSIDWFAACEWMYPNVPRLAMDRFTNFYSATSWQCIG